MPPLPFDYVLLIIVSTNITYVSMDISERIEQFQSKFDFTLCATAFGDLGGKFTLSNNAHPYL
jgi:hypothetical protein